MSQSNPPEGKEKDRYTKRQWIPPVDVFLPDLRNYAFHRHFHADSGYELAVTEGIRYCLLRRQWEEGLKLVLLLHQLEDPPFELVWKAGMACIRGKVFEEEEKLQKNPYLPRRYHRTLLTEYLMSLFPLSNSETFHILLNYEIALHLLYVHEDPVRAFEFLENLLYTHPYSELPYFIFLMGTLSLHLAEGRFQESVLSQQQDHESQEEPLGIQESGLFSSGHAMPSSLSLRYSDGIRFLRRARLCFLKLGSLHITSLDYSLELQRHRNAMQTLIDRFKGILDEEIEGETLEETEPDFNPTLEPSREIETQPTSESADELEEFLNTFDFECDDEKKWRKLTMDLFENKHRIPELFKYRQSWWFPFHFTHGTLNAHLLTYKSVIAYWVCPITYLKLSEKIWIKHKYVPKELLWFLRTINVGVGNLGCHIDKRAKET